MRAYFVTTFNLKGRRGRIISPVSGWLSLHDDQLRSICTFVRLAPAPVPVSNTAAVPALVAHIVYVLGLYTVFRRFSITSLLLFF